MRSKKVGVRNGSEKWEGESVRREREIVCEGREREFEERKV